MQRFSSGGVAYLRKLLYRHTKQPPIAFNILTLECDQIFVAAFDDLWCSIRTVVCWVPSKAKLDCGPLATPDVIVDLIITSPHSPNLLVFLSILLNYLRLVDQLCSHQVILVMSSPPIVCYIYLDFTAIVTYC